MEVTDGFRSPLLLGDLANSSQLLPTEGTLVAAAAGSLPHKQMGTPLCSFSPLSAPPPSGCRAGTSCPARSPRPRAPGRPAPGAPGTGPAPAARAGAGGGAWSRREGLERAVRRAECALPTEQGRGDRPRRAPAPLPPPPPRGPDFIRQPGRGGGAGGASPAAPSALTSPRSEPGRWGSGPREPSVFRPGVGRGEGCAHGPSRPAPVIPSARAAPDRFCPSPTPPPQHDCSPRFCG